MAYGLRKISKDGIHHGFKWPLEVGTVVKCPDWNPEPKCGNGLHFLPNAQGNWELLYGHYWAVIEYNPADLVMIGDDKGKVPKCKIVEIQDPKNLDPDKLLSYFDVSEFDSKVAYAWARNIGNHNVMIDKITESEFAYYWACTLGNKDIMSDRVTESRWAYNWMSVFGDHDVMINRVTESEWAYNWMRVFGDHDVMINRVTESEWAFMWAWNIGDQGIMIDRVTESEWACNWAIRLGDRDIMKPRITDPYWISGWNASFPDNQIKVN